jgi:predicted metalloprotease with PDZ domain
MGLIWRCLAMCFVGLAGVSNAGFAQCRFPATAHEQSITYRFHPEATPAGLVLHVRFSFRSSANGAQTLILPTQWAGETLHTTTNLRAVSKGASLEKGADADSMVIRAPPHRSVVIAYDLEKDWNGPLVHPFQFHPVLMREYVEFTGSNALVRLKLDDRAIETANFDWQALPAAWVLATSFGTTSSAADRCQTYTGSWRDVNEGLYAAGDYRIHPFRINGSPAFLAVRGVWTFSDNDAVKDVQKVVGMVRSFWHDDNFPYFLVTLSPYDQDHGSSDGSAFTNAFWMFVSRLDSFSGLLPVLAHESFHAWDPERMGSVPTGYNGDLIKWFREGPTEYYAQLLTYQAGELTAQEYIQSMNIALRRFPASNDEYVRGRIISLWLDGTIRRESGGRHSLDDVMFDMVRTGDQPYTLDRVLATAGRYLSPESRVLLQQAVTHHGDLPAPERLPVLGYCIHASLEDVPTFDLGLDFDRSRSSRTVTGVVENGPAFNAGLRDGQSLLGSSFSKGDPERIARFKVHTDAGDRQIEFYARGETIQAWQYHMGKDERCQLP